jgi:hypothetical protein
VNGTLFSGIATDWFGMERRWFLRWRRSQRPACQPLIATRADR